MEECKSRRLGQRDKKRSSQPGLTKEASNPLAAWNYRTESLTKHVSHGCFDHYFTNWQVSSE
jgi:hypothetical protein